MSSSGSEINTPLFISKLTTDICNAINNKQKVGAILIDIEKCFDSVWTNGVIYKMNQQKFPEKLLLLTICMIKGRNFYTADGDQISNIKGIIKNGLQQGTIFPPYYLTCQTVKS